MHLIYRGHIYLYTTIHNGSSRSARAINWRYRLPGTAQLEILATTPSTRDHARSPRTINWRYQLPGEGL